MQFPPPGEFRAVAADKLMEYYPRKAVWLADDIRSRLEELRTLRAKKQRAEDPKSASDTSLSSLRGAR